MNSSYNIAREPLYFVRSGWIGLNNSSLRGFGRNGFDWARSATTYSSATSAKAYNLKFHAGTVNPSDGPVNRVYGFPVRCLVY